MMRSNKFYLVTATILMVLMIATPSFAQKNAARIRFGKIEFAPAWGGKPMIPPGLAISGYQQGVRGYYILQFPGPIREAWKKQVIETGAEILDYIPDFAFKVRMTPEEALKVKELESVTWVGLYQPAYKLSPDLKRNGTHMYTVRIERSADVEAAKVAIAKSGAKVVRHKGNILKVTADSTQLEAIARVLDVAWIQNFMMWEKHNEYAAGEILGSSTANANGYDGSDQIIGIADTGLGGGTKDTAHLDLPQSRIKAIRVWTRAHFPQCIDFFCYCVEEILSNGAEDRDSGHGTHTTLSALGDGGPSEEGRGTAPGAQLIFQAVEDFVHYYPGPGYEGSIDTEFCEWLYDVKSGYYLSGIPSNIAELFQQAYNEGARIHSNSWGSNAMGAYTVDSRNADKFIWDLQDKDMTITYSAGNRGIDANGDGVIDSDSIGSPATAKNVITVGASENERDNYLCDDTLEMGRCDGDNQPLFTYGQAWPGDFPATPINGDPTAGNKEQMAAFSGRGPTNDGRIKPDLVAPGTFVLSGYSDLYQEGYDPSPNPQNSAWQYDGWSEPYSQYYKYMGGTSMSSPLVAGAAAVVRDFYQETDGHSASAALVKATLINSAHDLEDENNDGANDNDFPIPNVHEGWGRVDLANATDGSHQYVDNTIGLYTEGGQQQGSSTHYYSVVPNGPFKVTLVWSDYPSATGVSKNLVNDLDLKVTSPEGTIYLGNVFSGGWSNGGGTQDRTNNVENVYVLSPEEGTWTVEVKGFNVPYGPQPFALVVDGTFVQVDNPPSVSIFDPQEGQTLSGTYRVLINATDDFAVDSVALSIDGSDYIDITSNYDGTNNKYFYDWQTSEGDDDVGHTLQARATDNADPINDSYSEVVNITVDNIEDPPVNEPPVASFTYNCDWLTCEFDASTSFDPDGSIHTYAWDFGDGETASIADPVYTYLTAGEYNVELTVTDDDGAPGTATQTITVTDLTNTPPTVSFTADPTSGFAPLQVRFNATASDSDGSIASYAWTFGDGGTDDVEDPIYTYYEEGVYEVKLTVTDNEGGEGTADSHFITVTAPPNTLHVENLSVKSRAGRLLWRMRVTATVKDANGGPVVGATVWYSWSDSPGSIYGDCRTDKSGVCSVVGYQFRGTCLTFTVEDVSHNTLAYDPGQNKANDISACK